MLTHDDLKTLLACTRELYEPATLEKFPERLIFVLRKLIAGEYAVIEEMNMARARTEGFSDPPEARPVGNARLMAAFEQNMAFHPLIANFMATKSPKAETISDFVTRADWLDGTLYHEFYREVGNIEDQLGVFVASQGGLTIAAGIGRKRRTFTDRDRTVLTMLQPHIEQAYRNAELLTDLQIANQALAAELESLGHGVVRLDRTGGVLAINDAARRALEAAFPAWSRRPHRGPMPEPLLRWLGEHFNDRPSPPAASTGHCVVPIPAGGRLTVRVLRGRAGAVLLLTRDSPPAARSVERVRVSGLSPRLRQVFDLLLAGLSEKQIAYRLDLSPHTIHRHVSMLYRRLDVAGRAELMTRYLRVHAAE